MERMTLALGNRRRRQVKNIQRLRELKLEILSRCSLQCVHCSSDASPERTGFLEPSLVRPLVRSFRRLGGESVAISGGEPLEHPDLLSILRIVADESIQTTLYTSGTQGTDALMPISTESARSLKPLVATAVFSLQGATASEHDRFTGRSGSYETVLASLTVCQEVGIPVAVHFVPTSANYRSLPEVIALLKRLRVPCISLLRFVPHGRGAHHALALDAGQLSELRATVHSSVEDAEIAVRIGSPFRILHHPSSPPCTAGIDRLLITPEGTAYPCDAFKGFVYEDAYMNVFAVGLEAVWTRSGFLARARALVGKIPVECSGCEKAANCQGGCLAQRAFAVQALDSVHRDPDCTMAAGDNAVGSGT